MNKLETFKLKVVSVALASILQRKVGLAVGLVLGVGLGVSKGASEGCHFGSLGRKESEKAKNLKKSIVNLFTKCRKTSCCSLRTTRTS